MTIGGATTRGVVYVHSAIPALCPHVEWALARVFGMPVKLDWQPQPAAPGTQRAEASWSGSAGLGAALASALRGCGPVRAEVTEEPSPGADGARYAWTPTLGMFAAVTGASGDVLVSESRLSAAIAAADLDRVPLADALHRLLGHPWDDELEPFRRAGEGAPVRWMHAAV